MVQEVTQLIIDTSPLITKSTGVATGMMIAGGIQAVGSLIGGITGAAAARRRRQEAAREKQRLASKLEHLENTRQAIINPYASSIKDQSALIQDMGQNLTNAFNNLGVATQAAEMQAEEADIALANTLDTLRSTGASAGGATALAQAALASKKGVSANIEQQEAKNEQLRAQGEANLQRLRLSESQRVQQLQLGEGARVQTALAKGEAIKFDTRESRQQDRINQTYAQMGTAGARASQASRDRAAAISGAIGGVASGLGTFAGGVGKKAGVDSFLSGTGGDSYTGNFIGSNIGNDIGLIGPDPSQLQIPNLTSKANFNKYLQKYKID